MIKFPKGGSVTSRSVIIQMHVYNASFGEIEPLSDWLYIASSFCTCIRIDVLMKLEVQAHYLDIKQFFLDFCSAIFEWPKRVFGQ